MYLPVPLPNAHVRQTQVVFVSAVAKARPLTLMLQLTHADNVATLKEKLTQILDSTGVPAKSKKSKLQVVEVWEKHISRHVEDWTSLKYLKDKCEGRALYVVEIPPDDDDVTEAGSDVTEACAAVDSAADFEGKYPTYNHYFYNKVCPELCEIVVVACFTSMLCCRPRKTPA